MIAIVPNVLFAVPPIIPSTVTLPVPDSISKFIGVLSVDVLIVLVNLTAPFPADVSIVVFTSSTAAPVIVTLPTLLEASVVVVIVVVVSPVSSVNVVVPFRVTTFARVISWTLIVPPSISISSAE